MTMSIDYDVLLLPVFQEMLRLGVDVSLAEYLQAIKMLRNGMGLEDTATLVQACRLLWAKSREEQEMFDIAFAEKAFPKLAILASPIELGSGNETANPVNDTVSLEEKRLYHFTPRLPFSKTEMIGHWRQLRHIQRTGSARELDIEATIHDICQYGLLRRPFMRPRAGNATQLLLLIDQDGSMRPFKMLIEALVESVTRNSLVGKTALYYFHDCPGHTLYEDKLLGHPVALEHILARYAHNSRVLIVSDGGAARARYDDERVRNTRRFLERLHKYIYLYAWINPVPSSRWRFTTAEDIEKLVPMFPLDRDGLDDAIQILRGHPFPPGVSLHG